MSDEHLLGMLWALTNLANTVRLECRQRKWCAEAAAIQAMQEALKDFHRIREKGITNG